MRRWKGDSVRSRLVCRGFTETVTDEDQTYASTPLLVMVKLLILLPLSLSWHIELWDVGTAFLHAAVSGELYVVPPQEFYDRGTVLWRLKKALYGLRAAPRAWQDHLAELLHAHRFQRMQSEASVCVNMALKVVVLGYVDGLMVVGDQPAINGFMNTLTQSLLLNQTYG